MSEHFFSFLESISQRRRITGTEREENIQRVKKKHKKEEKKRFEEGKKMFDFRGKE